MKILYTSILLILFSIRLSGQTSGIVTDKSNGNPIADASVFVYRITPKIYELPETKVIPKKHKEKLTIFLTVLNRTPVIQTTKKLYSYEILMI